MKKKSSNNTQNSKDPEQIYMSDIFQILKDQKQKIDHLLRQTKNELTQNNSRIKGFWNSSSSNAEPSTIPCKILNDIQGYENNADKINNILHKKVNQLKRITMKKKTYEEIEQREKDKQAFARYATPEVRMNFRNSIPEKEQKQQNPANKKIDTYSHVRAGSVQLESNDPTLAQEGWSKRQKFNKQPLSQPLKEIDNKSKTIGILKRKSNDTTRTSLEEITKIYSPRTFTQKQKLDEINGQSMIVESNNGFKDQFLNKSMDITGSGLEILCINSARNKQSKDLENLVSKDKFIDKENNQQYLLKQVQQQNIKLTEKQNQILYRQLLEQSQQNNRGSEFLIGGLTPTDIRRNSMSSCYGISKNEIKSTGFLPSLNKKNSIGEESQIDDSTYNTNGQIDMQKTQKKYGNYPNENEQTPDKQNYQNYDFPQIHGGKQINVEIIPSAKDQNKNQCQQNNVTKNKRSQSLQQQNIYSQSRNLSSDNEEKLKLINKYKQTHLIENSDLKLPSESEIYPINIINDKKSDNQNFFKKEGNEIPLSYERSNNLSVNLQSLSHKENSQRYSYDLNCHSVPLNTNQSFSSYKDGGYDISMNNNIRLNADKYQQERTQNSTPNYLKQNQNQNDYNNKNNGQSDINRREYTSQDTGEAKYQIKSTELSSQKPPLRDVSKNQYGSSRNNNSNQSQPEFISSQDSSCITADNKYKQKDGIQLQYQNTQTSDELNPHPMNSIFTDNDKREQECGELYELVPNQVNFSVKKEDLKNELTKLTQQQKYEQNIQKLDQIQYENQKNYDSQLESISNQNINEDLKSRLQQNFLQRLGLSGVFPPRVHESNQDKALKNKTQQNSPRDKSSDSKNGDISKIDKERMKWNKVKFNDPNLFNYHKLIGCVNLDEKSKKAKHYQHYHSNEREKQEKRYYEVLNEKLNYQIEINLLFLEQSLLKSKSQTKKQLLEKLKSFRQEIVEASQSQERSIQNLKRQYKHLYSFNLPESLFIY